ncbi:unnamed protein product [Closterium sp. NIES-65]|nr:unnamed protein product [Closterium sp. NIES-65]
MDGCPARRLPDPSNPSRQYPSAAPHYPLQPPRTVPFPPRILPLPALDLAIKARCAIAGALQRLLDGFGSVECGDERLDGVQSGGEGGERGGRGEVVVIWQAGARHVSSPASLSLFSCVPLSLLLLPSLSSPASLSLFSCFHLSLLLCPSLSSLASLSLFSCFPLSLLLRPSLSSPASLALFSRVPHSLQLCPILGERFLTFLLSLASASECPSSPPFPTLLPLSFPFVPHPPFFHAPPPFPHHPHDPSSTPYPMVGRGRLVDRMDMWVARALFVERMGLAYAAVDVVVAHASSPFPHTPPSPHHLHGPWFVERMDLAYAPADVVVARAGAVTCSELLTTPTPCILIPSPHVAEDHQTVNARAMVQAGAAVMLPQDQLSPDTLLSAVTSLLADGARREKMEECAGAAASADAADVMAQEVLRLALQQQQHRKHKAKFA